MSEDEVLERAWLILDRLSARSPDPLLREVAAAAADRLLIAIDGIADVGEQQAPTIDGALRRGGHTGAAHVNGAV